MKHSFHAGSRGSVTSILLTLPAIGLLLTAACSDDSSPGGTGGAATGGATSTAGQAGATAVGGASGSTSAGATSGGAPATAGATNGMAGSGSGGVPTAGTTGTGGSGGGGGTAGDGVAGSGGASGSAGTAGTAGTGGAATTEKFSFFVTSLAAIVRESKSEKGFGGNLGGLAGADAICTKIAETSMPGAGAKGWKAFLSTSKENAISRIGSGPWYDRAGRLIAMNLEGLTSGNRPAGDSAIINDLPNEDGAPNQAGTGGGKDDNHDTITGSNTKGEWDGGSTCSDWTSATGGDGPRVGHSWPAQSGQSWIQAHTAPGCEPSVNLVQNGPGSGNGIGNGGGYGGFYCFALKP